MWLFGEPDRGLIQMQTNLVFLLVCFLGRFPDLLYDAAVRCKCQHKQGGGTSGWGQEGGQKRPPLLADGLIYATSWRSGVAHLLRTGKWELLPCTGTRVSQKGGWQHHSSLNVSSFWLPVLFLLTNFVFYTGDVCEVWHPSLRKLFFPAAEHPMVQVT